MSKADTSFTLRTLEDIVETLGPNPKFDDSLAFTFERYAVPKSKHVDAPKRAREVYDLDDQGCSVIARHPVYGWAVIGGGQGPYIAWQQDPVITNIADRARRYIRNGNTETVLTWIVNLICCMGILCQKLKHLRWNRPGERDCIKYESLSLLFDRVSETAKELNLVLYEEGM